MRTCVLTILMALVTVCAAPADAQRRDTSKVRRAQQAVDRGDKFFDEKKYEQAIAEYTQAIAILPHPDLVWNIARAHEELKQYTQAIALYERYRTMDVPAADKAAVDDKIRALRQAAARQSTGQLVVVTSSRDAVVKLGKATIGTGKMIKAPLKPGRYRLRVELVGHVPFEQMVRVEPGKVRTVEAALKRAEKRAVMLVKVNVDGAMVSFDGGRPVSVGIPVPVSGGAHKLRVTAPNRAPVERLLEAAPGERKTIVIEMGPEVAPDSYASWSGEYVVIPLGDTAADAVMSAGRLTLTEESGRVGGKLTVARERTLKAWRRPDCGGAEKLTWTASWKADMRVSGTAAQLAFSGGTISDCSCARWCTVESSASAAMYALPGREGVVSKTAVVLRAGVVGEATSPWHTGKAAVTGHWQGLLWEGRPGSNRVEFTSESKGVFWRRVTGRVPSWKRSSCPGATEFEQWVTHVATWSAPHLRLAEPNEDSCSCGDICGTPPAIKQVHELKRLLIPRYLVGDGIILRRTPPKEK